MIYALLSGSSGREVEGELANTPPVVHAGYANTHGCDGPCSEPGIGLLPNLEGFLLSPPCGPFCCPRLPLAGSVVWGRPLLFSFLFPSRFFLPLLVGKFTLSRRRFASTSRQWATILAQVLANSYLTKVESSLQRVSLKRQPAQGPAA